MSLLSKLRQLIGGTGEVQDKDAQHGAYMAQRKGAQSAADAFPWLMYVAVIDASTRPGHAALDGRIWRKDDPVWKAIYPPNGTGCRCRTRALTDGQLRREALQPTGPAKVLRRKAADGSTEVGVRFFDQLAGRDVTVWL